MFKELLDSFEASSVADKPDVSVILVCYTELFSL